MGISEFAEELLDRHPDETPYLIHDSVLSHGELRKQVAAEASALAAASIGDGTTVALQVAPSFTQVEALLALWRLGAQVMLLDHRLKPAEVGALLELCRPQYLVRSPGAAWRALQAFRERRELVTESRVDGQPAASEHRLVQFSSGSTGLPKVIGRTPQSLATEVERFTRVDGMPKAGERILLLSSTAHSFGLVAGLLHSLAVGVGVVFAHRVSSTDILDTAITREVNALFGVPFHYDLLGAVSRPPELPHLRAAVSGGEQLPAAVSERFAERYGVRVGESYGTTETGVIAMDVSGRLRPAVGRAAPGVELRIHQGELEVALPSSPYLRLGGSTEDVDRYRDGWLRTRDRAELDSAGAVRLHGRGDSLVVIGGLKVDLTEVEDVLRQHPAVTEVVLVHDQAIEAYVSTGAAEVTGEELIGWCRDQLADYKLPKLVRVLPSLPRTSNGKLVRERSALHAAGTP